MSPTLMLIATMVLAVTANPTPSNVVMDANRQALGPQPIFSLCSYMTSADFSEFFVNGVDEDSDDYSRILGMFEATESAYAVLNICLQEAFQINKAPYPSQVYMRCFCRRNGCNIPQPLKVYLDFNKLVNPFY